jgi:hypothetical protein
LGARQKSSGTHFLNEKIGPKDCCQKFLLFDLTNQTTHHSTSQKDH